MLEELWEVEYFEEVNDDTTWTEIHRPKNKSRISYLSLADFIDTEIYQNNEIESRFMLYIKVASESDFKKFENKEVYKEMLSSKFPEIKTYYEPQTQDTFLGFEKLETAMEYIEKIKKMVESDEL